MPNSHRVQKQLSTRLLRQPHEHFYKARAHRWEEADFFSPIIYGVGIELDESGEDRIILLSSLDLEAHNVLLSEEIYREYQIRVSVLYAGPPLLAARPTLGGDSVSAAGISPTGTVGCKVQDGRGKTHLLSCNHVLADSYGFLRAGQVGLKATDIWQPGHNDGGKSTDTIGTLNSAEPINFNTGTNVMDAALAEISKSADIDSGVRDFGTITGLNPSPRFNINVRKNGWSTGKTQGKLRIKNLSILLTYKHGTAQFDDQYGVIGAGTNLDGSSQPYFALQGDSGALVIDGSHAAVGMIFAVASGIDLAYVTPIEPILNQFKVTIV